MGPEDQVILVTHQPRWLMDWFWEEAATHNLRQLVRGHLRGRARIHLAGQPTAPASRCPGSASLWRLQATRWLEPTLLTKAHCATSLQVTCTSTCATPSSRHRLLPQLQLSGPPPGRQSRAAHGSSPSGALRPSTAPASPSRPCPAA